MFAQVHDFSIWPKVEPMVAKALERSGGRFEARDILAALYEGRQQLWLHADTDIDLCVITEVIQYPRKRALSIFLCVGRNRDSWIGHMADLERFGAERGCSLIEAWARPGWARVLGWKKTHVLLEKVLGHVVRS